MCTVGYGAVCNELGWCAMCGAVLRCVVRRDVQKGGLVCYCRNVLSDDEVAGVLRLWVLVNDSRTTRFL